MSNWPQLTTGLSNTITAVCRHWLAGLLGSSVCFQFRLGCLGLSLLPARLGSQFFWAVRSVCPLSGLGSRLSSVWVWVWSGLSAWSCQSAWAGLNLSVRLVNCSLGCRCLGLSGWVAKVSLAGLSGLTVCLSGLSGFSYQSVSLGSSVIVRWAGLPGSGCPSTIMVIVHNQGSSATPVCLANCLSLGSVWVPSGSSLWLGWAGCLGLGHCLSSVCLSVLAGCWVFCQFVRLVRLGCLGLPQGHWVWAGWVCLSGSLGQ